MLMSSKDLGAAFREAELLAADAIGDIIEHWGFRKVLGRVWTVLFIAGDPLPAAVIGERLQMSAGAVSMALTELQRWGVVKRVWRPGERKEFFEAETDFWKMISGVLNERERREIRAAITTMNEAEAEVRAARRAFRGKARTAAAHTAERLARLRAVCELGEVMLETLLGNLTLDVTRVREILRP